MQREWIYNLPLTAEGKILLMYICDNDGETITYTQMLQVISRSRQTNRGLLNNMEFMGWVIREKNGIDPSNGDRYYKGDKLFK